MQRLVPAIATALAGALALACATSREKDPGAVAAAYAAAGNYEEAVREIDLAVRAQPGNAKLRLQAADIHTKAGDPDRAIVHLELVVNQIAPTDAEAWIQLGDLERGRENVPDAYVAYRRASQLAPDDIRAVSGLALSADALGFTDEARVAYARWSEIEEKLDREGP